MNSGYSDQWHKTESDWSNGINPVVKQSLTTESESVRRAKALAEKMKASNAAKPVRYNGRKSVDGQAKAAGDY
jgi:hypothetical protein